MNIAFRQIGRILLVSIQQGSGHDNAFELQSNLLPMIARTEALGVAIDISTLDVLGSFMARLVCTKVIVSGSQPMVAFALVEMGREMIGADSTFNLDQSLKILQKRIAMRADHAWVQDGHHVSS